MNDDELIGLARNAMEHSYSPYSDFSVGAAIHTPDGPYTGTNIESSVNGLSLCAERVALFKAISEGSTTFNKLAVVCGDSYCRPCGACRQVLHEHAPNLTVLMADCEGNYQSVVLKTLLPKAFEI